MRLCCLGCLVPELVNKTFKLFLATVYVLQLGEKLLVARLPVNHVFIVVALVAGDLATHYLKCYIGKAVQQVSVVGDEK